MASEKLRRKNIHTGKRNVDHVEKEKIPVHFEAQQNSTIRSADKRSDKAKHIAKDTKDATTDTTKTVPEHISEKAVAAKDVAVESAKGAAGYVGKVGAQVKDQAAVGGWGTAHYTMEKVAEATEAVAGAASSVAGYTGEKAGTVKDKIGGAGQTVVGYAGEKVAAAKDAVVEAEEKSKEYAARKKEEAWRDMEMKKSAREEEGGEEQFTTKGQFGATEGFFDDEARERAQGGSSSILHAIGETIMEIGQTTKKLLIGQYPIRVMEHRDEADDRDEPYTTAGKGTY